MRIGAQLHDENLCLKASLSSEHKRLAASLNVSVQASGDFSLGHALMWDKQGRLAVKVADEAEADNTLPITAAAVYAELGNIEVLLSTI